MAVIPGSISLHWHGSTGSVSREPLGAEYTAVWRLWVDDPNDQAQTVLTWFQNNVVLLGTAYDYAGDTAASVARADRIRARRELGSTDIWQVVVNYTTPQDEEGEDASGNATLVPTDFRPTLDLSMVTYSEPVEESEFHGGYKGKAKQFIPKNTWVMPMNSALVPFNPPAEKDAHRIVLRVTRNMLTFDGDEADKYANTVNAQPFKVNYRGVTMRFKKLEAKIREWSLAMRRQNGLDFLEVSCVIDRASRTKDNTTWIQEIVDRGLAARALDGDPDGKGGVISPGTHVWPKGVPRLRKLVDNDQNPITEPVLFDGDGQPIDLAKAPKPIEPVYGKWLHYRQENFKTIDWGSPRVKFFQGIIK